MPVMKDFIETNKFLEEKAGASWALAKAVLTIKQFVAKVERIDAGEYPGLSKKEMTAVLGKLDDVTIGDINAHIQTMRDLVEWYEKNWIVPQEYKAGG